LLKIMKVVLVILILSLLAVPSSAQTKSKRPAQANGMSPAFRDKARRAWDAIQRLPLTTSARARMPGFEQRKLDVEKAIDEAKYKAHTIKENQVLMILQETDFLIGALRGMHILDPDWGALDAAELQCETELRAEFGPGRRDTPAKTCLKQSDAIFAARSKRRAADSAHQAAVEKSAEAAEREIQKSLDRQVKILQEKLEEMQGEQRSLLEMERLTRAEERAEQLRSQLRNVQSKIADFESKLKEIDSALKPENIDRFVSMSGTTRPKKEARDARRRELESERVRINSQLDSLATTVKAIGNQTADADKEVERLRAQLKP
jgi:DNA repair exonuclease SbcCD ATPase subunit